MDRRAKLLSDISIHGRSGLEIGPLNAPIVGKSEGDVAYVDHCSRAGLIAKYTGEVAPESIADVDVVWPGGSLRAAAGGRTFDYVIASHVIEHVPDLVGWLAEIAGVLRPGGVLALAIPDKRYTFDVARPVSTVGEMIASHLEHRTVPSVKQLYDNYTMSRAAETARLWDGSQDVQSLPYLHERGVAETFVQRVRSGEYVDCHCWIFTPRSFFDAMRALAAGGYVSFGLRRYFETAHGENEFIVALSAAESAPDGFLLPNAGGETVDNGMV
jgi:predicted SAM-dependent methyltransferase